MWNKCVILSYTKLGNLLPKLSYALWVEVRSTKSKDPTLLLYSLT
jgi:hypothetical protein